MTQLLDTSDLAARYNGRVSEKTITNWRYTGCGPTYIKIGGRVFYTIEAIEQWEERRHFWVSGPKLALA